MAGLASGKTGAGGPGVAAGCGSVPGGCGASHKSLLLWLRAAGFGGSAALVGCFVGVEGLGVEGVALTVVPAGLRSSLSRRGGGLAWTGTYLRRNLRFLSVILPEPSTRVMYWSNCFTSVMTPVLSHRVGWGPVWFWILTWSPTARGGSLLVCSAHLSDACMWRFLRASSLKARVSRHVGCGM